MPRDPNQHGTSRSGATRRQFIQTTAVATAGFWVANSLSAEESKAANEQINFACVGIGGKGSSDTGGAAAHGKIVGICDVDTQRLDGAARRYTDAESFTDFREMLDKLGDKIDAVTVSTPDHSHAPAALKAMKMGKHCFCQKPLTHTIWEAREMGKVAAAKGLATQMGNQGTSHDGLREAAAVLKAGTLGKVSEVHVWTNRPVWPQGGDKPAPTEPPAHLEWDMWLAGAKERPFGKGYHPFSWRGFWDFGTGALGDMACHTMNMPFMGLDLLNPTSVQAETSGHNGYSYPKWSVITFEFPKNSTRDALTVYWYDGGKRPPSELFDGKQPGSSGCLIVGEKGKIYTPDDYGSRWEFLGGDLEKPKVEFPKSPGHVQEWVRAIRGGEAAMSNFPNYASPLTETILLGNLAVWATGEDGKSKKIEWDSETLKAKDMPELDKIVKPQYRDGWEA